MDELQRAQMEVGLKIASRREVMQRLGKQNIPELLKEIDKDILDQAVLQAQVTLEVQEMTGESGEEEPNENEE